MTLRLLDLFSGIGGFSLGLERTGGFKTVAFCEIEPFCRKVLAKHWPEVPCYHDVRELSAERLAADGIGVDVICGGFPCQDISVAGKGAGLESERSGLWSEYARIIGELRPRYVIVENVSALLGRGLDKVLGDLASLGFDAEWHCIPASAVGAPHRRDRIWIVAYAGCLSGAGRRETNYLAGSKGACEINGKERQWDGDASDDCRSAMALSLLNGLQGPLRPELQSVFGRKCESVGGSNQWLAEPHVGRVANGVPSRFHGDLNDEARMGTTQDGSESGRIRGPILRGLLEHGTAAKTPPRLQSAHEDNDSLCSMSRFGGSSSGLQASEASEAVQGLRQGLHAEPQQEAQHLQQGMPFDYWPHERDGALGIWEIEPDVPRVATGVKNRMDSLKGLGNAVVPQIPELIGNAILASLKQAEAA